MAMNLQDIFTIITNRDKRQYEFTPQVKGYNSYSVSFDEADNEADAWIIIYLSLKSQKERNEKG